MDRKEPDIHPHRMDGAADPGDLPSRPVLLVASPCAEGVPVLHGDLRLAESVVGGGQLRVVAALVYVCMARGVLAFQEGMDNLCFLSPRARRLPSGGCWSRRRSGTLANEPLS